MDHRYGHVSYRDVEPRQGAYPDKHALLGPLWGTIMDR